METHDFSGKGRKPRLLFCFDGENIILTKSVRRVSTSWKSYLSFYASFKSASWELKTGLGGRIVPTKVNRDPIGSSFSFAARSH